MSDLQDKLGEIKTDSESLKRAHLREAELMRENVKLREEKDQLIKDQPCVKEL